MDKDSKQVVVLLTHPNIKESRANKALMDAISDMGEVAIYNLYEMRMEDAFNAEIWSTIIIPVFQSHVHTRNQMLSSDRYKSYVPSGT